MGRFEAAYELCLEAVGLEGRVPPGIAFDFTDVYVEAGLVAEKLGRPEEAVRHFEEALRRAPDHPQRDAILAKVRKLRERPSAP